MDITERRIRIACIDVFDEPDNVDSCAALAALITSATPPEISRATAQCLRTACTDLLDEPHSRAAQLHVLELLGIHPVPA